MWKLAVSITLFLTAAGLWPVNAKIGIQRQQLKVEEDVNEAIPGFISATVIDAMKIDMVKVVPDVFHPLTAEMELMDAMTSSYSSAREHGKSIRLPATVIRKVKALEDILPLSDPTGHDMITTMITRTTSMHRDHSRDINGKRQLVTTPTSIIFMNNNPDAYLSLDEEGMSIPIIKGSLVKFDGSKLHHTIINDGIVQLVGPFEGNRLSPVGDPCGTYGNPCKNECCETGTICQNSRRLKGSIDGDDVERKLQLGNCVCAGVLNQGDSCVDFGSGVSCCDRGTGLVCAPDGQAGFECVTAPTKSPTNNPTKNPTDAPTDTPTDFPTKNPTKAPTVCGTYGNQCGEGDCCETGTTCQTSRRLEGTIEGDNVERKLQFGTCVCDGSITLNNDCIDYGDGAFPGRISCCETGLVCDTSTRRLDRNPNPIARLTGICVAAPTNSPTNAPITFEPTVGPTNNPTKSPTDAPTDTPTKNPTEVPSDAPSESSAPSVSAVPSQVPSETNSPSMSVNPSQAPSVSINPTQTENPTQIPSMSPSLSTSPSVSINPTQIPTASPVTPSPTDTPTKNPSDEPTDTPTKKPSTKSPITDKPTVDKKELLLLLLLLKLAFLDYLHDLIWKSSTTTVWSGDSWDKPMPGPDTLPSSPSGKAGKMSKAKGSKTGKGGKGTSTTKASPAAPEGDTDAAAGSDSDFPYAIEKNSASDPDNEGALLIAQLLSMLNSMGVGEGRRRRSLEAVDVNGIKAKFMKRIQTSFNGRRDLEMMLGAGVGMMGVFQEILNDNKHLFESEDMEAVEAKLESMLNE